jgi:hypothetical protein
LTGNNVGWADPHEQDGLKTGVTGGAAHHRMLRQARFRARLPLLLCFVPPLA